MSNWHPGFEPSVPHPSYDVPLGQVLRSYLIGRVSILFHRPSVSVMVLESWTTWNTFHRNTQELRTIQVLRLYKIGDQMDSLVYRRSVTCPLGVLLHCSPYGLFATLDATFPHNVRQSPFQKRQSSRLSEPLLCAQRIYASPTRQRDIAERLAVPCGGNASQLRGVSVFLSSGSPFVVGYCAPSRCHKAQIPTFTVTKRLSFSSHELVAFRMSQRFTLLRV